ncbi:MAG: SDR family NAD(P)-dependent oxidoreductase [Burkholderiales bacterium]|nr:SDR family NAD(P)-dependent oxidoreductase [Burkholderiales bacterium]
MSLNPRIQIWPGQVVWIVGASSGIGAATARALHAQGAQVIVSARNHAALTEFTRRHPGSTRIPLDTTDAEAVRSAVKSIQAQFGHLDLVMYCAGHYRPMRATQLDLGEVKKHQAVNVDGAWHVLQAVVPLMLSQGHGHISLVGSVAGYRGLPQSLAYGPTKAALQQMAEILYLDLRSAGLGVSIINPGFVATPLTAQNKFDMPALLSPDQAAQAILKGWGSGRFEIHFPKRFTWGLKLMQLLPHALYFALVRRGTGL